MSIVERIETAKQEFEQQQEKNIQLLKACSAMNLLESINEKYLENSGKIDEWGGVNDKEGYFVNKIILRWEGRTLRYRGYPEQTPILGIYIVASGGSKLEVGQFRYFTYWAEHSRMKVIDRNLSKILFKNVEELTPEEVEERKDEVAQEIADLFARITNPSSADYWETRNGFYGDIYKI